MNQRWSALWAGAGSINHTTSIPVTIEGKIALGNKLVTCFTNHSGDEVPNMQVTARGLYCFFGVRSLGAGRWSRSYRDRLFKAVDRRVRIPL